MNFGFWGKPFGFGKFGKFPFGKGYGKIGKIGKFRKFPFGI